MAKRWTPSSWNRAHATKIKSVEKARIETESASLIAWERTIGGEREYWVQISGVKYYIYTYNNKDEANAKWLELKNRYF